MLMTFAVQGMLIIVFLLSLIRLAIHYKTMISQYFSDEVT